MKKRFFALMEKTEFGQRILQDHFFRTILFAAAGMGWNLIYALFNGILGIVYQSFWFVTMFAYYAALGAMKLYVISLERSKNPKRNEKTVMQRLGLSLIGLSVVIVGIITLTIEKGVTNQYNNIIMISIATFTFFIVIKAIVNMVKAHRKKQPRIIMLRNITCASAVGSLLSLERSMLGTFGEATARFTYVMEGASGLGAFIIIIALGVSMLHLSRRKQEE